MGSVSLALSHWLMSLAFSVPVLGHHYVLGCGHGQVPACFVDGKSLLPLSGEVLWHWQMKAWLPLLQTSGSPIWAGIFSALPESSF